MLNLILFLFMEEVKGSVKKSKGSNSLFGMQNLLHPLKGKMPIFLLPHFHVERVKIFNFETNLVLNKPQVYQVGNPDLKHDTARV